VNRESFRIICHSYEKGKGRKGNKLEIRVSLIFLLSFEEKIKIVGPTPNKPLSPISLVSQIGEVRHFSPLSLFNASLLFISRVPNTVLKTTNSFFTFPK